MFFNHVLSRRAKLKSQIQAHWSWQDNKKNVRKNLITLFFDVMRP